MSDTTRKRQVTVRLEVNGTDEQWLQSWIWESPKAYLREGPSAKPTHGCLVTGIFDDDLIKKNRDLEARLAEYEEAFGPLRDFPEGEDDEDPDLDGPT